MKRKRVQSSNIASVGWADNVVEVEFQNGAVWRYSPVSEALARELQHADSVGSFFHKNIKSNPAIAAEKR